MGRSQGSRNLSNGFKEKIVDMVNFGLTQKKVADYYCIPVSTIKSIMRYHRLASNLNAKKKMGRKLKLGPRCVRRLILYVRKNNKMPLYTIAANFRASNGTKLSERTIRGYLHKNGIHSFVAAAKPYLSLKYIDARLNRSTE